MYLDAALKEVDIARESTQDHTFALPRVLLPPDIEYADDTDFICKNSEDPTSIIKTVRPIFDTYTLHLNDSKTEIAQIDGKSDLTKIKKLNSILDDTADINRRKLLSNIALNKYKPV